MDDSDTLSLKEFERNFNNLKNELNSLKKHIVNTPEENISPKKNFYENTIDLKKPKSAEIHNIFNTNHFENSISNKNDLSVNISDDDFEPMLVLRKKDSKTDLPTHSTRKYSQNFFDKKTINSITTKKDPSPPALAQQKPENFAQKKKQKRFFHLLHNENFSKQIIEFYEPILKQYIKSFKHVYQQCYQKAEDKDAVLENILKFFRKVKIKYSYQNIKKIYSEILDWENKFQMAENHVETLVKNDMDYPFVNHKKNKKISFVKFLVMICLICHCCYSPKQKLEKEGLGFFVLNLRAVKEYRDMFPPLNSKYLAYYKGEVDDPNKENECTNIIVIKNEFMNDYAENCYEKFFKPKIEKPANKFENP